MYERLQKILQQLLSGDLSCLNPENIEFVSKCAETILNQSELDDYYKTCTDLIISMSQIVYNNTDRPVLFLDDGVYDLLLEKDKIYNKNFQVGSPVVNFDNNGELKTAQEFITPMVFLDNPEEFKEKSLYFDDIMFNMPVDINLCDRQIDRNSGKTISKRNVNVPHMYPKLVGSLDKCKFTLDVEARDRGVYDDQNVKIFERDFLAKHLQMGLIDMNTPFEMVAELKYDGVSVEADVTDHIISARSRGDANADVAADMSDIFAGYVFPYAPKMADTEAFGMKFEAIINYMNLDKLGQLKGKYYKNSRNGIIGLLGSSDAYDYRDLITLVPLATSMEDLDRVQEIEFLNKYYNSGEYLRYSVLRGTYTEILYQVHKFVKEAETLRPILPFMYDGVVISYRDPEIIKALGRENSINKYSMAIKFNPLVREAIFTGYTYTIGQDGTVTPMIHYTPVEFYGTIHTKSSGHSYNRFNELKLRIGDIIQVEYTNDVMPYVTKHEQSLMVNTNPVEQFPEVCPCCGTPLVINKSGKSAMCPNINCPERVIAKMANMMDKLNLKDFGEETFRALGTTSLHQLLNYTLEDVSILGPMTSQKLMDRINEIKNSPIYDYQILGSIGFSGIAIETWRKILNVIPLEFILEKPDPELFGILREVKGIGEVTANTIVSERHYLEEDLADIMKFPKLIRSFGLKSGKVIRYSGCRPTEELTMYLTSKGYDARPDAGVTKDTDILVIPYIGFSSSKVTKAQANENTSIIDYAKFSANPDIIEMLDKIEI